MGLESLEVKFVFVLDQKGDFRMPHICCSCGWPIGGRVHWDGNKPYHDREYCKPGSFSTGMAHIEETQRRVRSRDDETPETDQTSSAGGGKWPCACKGGTKMNNASKRHCGKCGADRPW